MADAVDLDAYFARIGYEGPRAPTLGLLQALHRLHPRAIPFENLDPLLGRAPKLDLAGLQAKLVAGRRGGYCFEHNSLFAAVLRALGFRVTGLAARVQWMAPPERVNARTHMLLRVDLLEGPYVADVGFGGLVQIAPVKLEPMLEQTEPNGGPTFRLVPLDDGGEMQLQVMLADGWAPMHRFASQPQEPIDYELANWFTATHPASPFTANLMAAFMTDEARLGLLNNQLTVRRFDGGVEKRTLTAAELDALLHDELGLARPGDEAALAALYERLATP